MRGPTVIWSVLVLASCGDSRLISVEPGAGAPPDAGAPVRGIDAGNSAFDAGLPEDAGTSAVDSGISQGVVDASAPVSVCGVEDEEITRVSTQWGPAWSRPDPAKILDGWPLELRYELWWIPLPAAPTGTLAYRIRVPADFDADTDPTPARQLGYVNTIESPSTGVTVYESAVSETACDFRRPIAFQSPNPPYGPSQFTSYSDWSNALVIYFQVRPKTMSHCVPLPAGYFTICLEPGHTYWWNLRVVPGGCDGEIPGNTSRCQPMIHVMRPRKVLEQ